MQTEPTGPLILDRQCVAAATMFARASLATFRQAEEPGLKQTPEAAVLRRRARLYSDLMQDMLELAAEHSTRGRSHAQD